MKTPLALSNLSHKKASTAVAAAGIMFALVLIFMQFGFLGAVKSTATLIYDGMDYDIMLRSPSYVHMCDARFFPRTRVQQASALPEIQSARRFYVGLNNWQHPDPLKGDWRAIVVMGTDPSDPVFVDQEIRAQAAYLGNPEFVLMDRKSKAAYGPKNKKRFSDQDINVVTSIGGKQVAIMGHFALGTGFAADGAALMSDEGYCRVSQVQTINDVSLGIIRLHDRSKALLVKQQLQRLFKPYGDVRVLTKAEVDEIEQGRWVNETNVGTIFKFGLAISLIVGVVIVYQVLSTDVANMLGEYATLKAMGYTNGYLSKVIIQQAALLAVLGYLPALAVSWGCPQRLSGFQISQCCRYCSWVKSLGLTCSVSVVSGATPLTLIL
jgi:putative ABC transport system permease protein